LFQLASLTLLSARACDLTRCWDDQVDAFCQGVLWIEAQYWRGWGNSW